MAFPTKKNRCFFLNNALSGPREQNINVTLLNFQVILICFYILIDTGECISIKHLSV